MNGIELVLSILGVSVLISLTSAIIVAWLLIRFEKNTTGK